MESTKMKIEVWSDVICPFCYIGKRHFEQALEKFSNQNDIELIWRCYQLDPDIQPGEHLTSPEYLVKRKNIGVGQVKQLLENVTAMAEKAGLTFRMDKAIIANSMDAHRLSHLAAKYDKQTELEELMFKAHFTEGKNIADHKVLLDLAKEAGIPQKEAEDVLNSTTYRDEVLADISEAADFNIRGVPFFVFNRKYAVSGAQPPQAFTETLEAAFKEWSAKDSDLD
jgi:protein disulfide-isomerase